MLGGFFARYNHAHSVELALRCRCSVLVPVVLLCDHSRVRVKCLIVAVEGLQAVPIALVEHVEVEVLIGNVLVSSKLVVLNPGDPR